MNIICIDARMIHNSGIGIYLKTLITSLNGVYRLVLLGNPEEIKKALPDINADLITCTSRIYSIKEQLEVPLKVPACDLLITPHYNVPLLPVKAKKRLSIIHDTNHLAFYENLNIAEKVYARVMINMALRRSDAVITISEFSKSEIIKYTNTDSSKLKLLYFGIDSEKITAKLKTASLDVIKNRYNLPDKYLLFVGNIKPHKNLSGLLRAYAILFNKRKDHKLVVVGRKEGFIISDSEVFRLIEDNPALKENIHFTGYVEEDDLPGIYKLASVFIFPSLYEGFGIPPLEAIGCGTPVAASDAASIPEVCGDAVIYIDPHSPADIAEKIELLLNNPSVAGELADKGKLRLEKFSLTNFSHNLLTIIKEIL